MKKNKTAKFLTFILLVLAMNTIYVLPYLMYTYYTPLQEAMGLVGRDADYGKLLNVYGIANVILYLPGGWIADKFNPKKLLVFSMISTGILGLWEATWPSYSSAYAHPRAVGGHHRAHLLVLLRQVCQPAGRRR